MVKWQIRDGQFSAKTTGTGKPSAPWFLCFIDFVQHTLWHAPEGSLVHLVCDEHADYAALAQTVWLNMKIHKALGWQKMGGLTFDTDEKHEPLQLADMYAYLINHAIPRYGQGIDADRRAALLALTSDDQPVYLHTAETLEKRAQEITEEVMSKIELHYGNGK